MPSNLDARVSVVVPTRERPDHVRQCVKSILASTADIEVIVVDQSVDESSSSALAVARTDPRLRYVRSTTRGSSLARNEGAALASAGLIVFTDDDCRVPSDWIGRIMDAFTSDPRAAIICGRVRMPSGLAAAGLAAEFEPRQRVYEGRFPSPGRDWGITANMAMRRDAFQRLAGFDEVLGVGAPLRAAADYDFIARALRAGLRVVNASEVEVSHVGVRPHGPPTAALLRGYAFGAGAFAAKQARLGAAGRGLALRWLVHHLVANIRGVITLDRDPGIMLTISFVRGAVASLHYRIDPSTSKFAARDRDRAKSA